MYCKVLSEDIKEVKKCNFNKLIENSDTKWKQYVTLPDC